MKVISKVHDIQAILSCGSVATVGNFDGVHLGHQQLLTRVSEQARFLGLPSLVILFEPQPNEFFCKEHAPVRLSRLREKLDYISRYDIDYVYCMKFNKALASMPAEEFAMHYLFSQCRIKHLYLGGDFRFGYNRLGTVQLLSELSEKNDCVVHVCEDFLIDGQRVSSTRIRSALQNGQLDLSEQLLGRPYSLSGRVQYGKALARRWGIPTANLALHRRRSPLKGVFFVAVQRYSESQFYRGVANVGVRPTLHATEACLEVHLLDFDDNLYGNRLKVTFLHALRDEIKFPNVNELIAQIHDDVVKARLFFDKMPVSVKLF